LEVPGLSRKEFVMAIVRKSGSLVEHEGRVLSVSTREEAVMSDVYAPVTRAKVVNDDGSVTEVYVRSHFECDASDAVATVDVTDEFRELAFAYTSLNLINGIVAVFQKDLKAAQKLTPSGTREPRKGDMVMVTGKAPGLTKGEFHTVVWAGTSRFSESVRLGVMVDGAKRYAPASKFELVLSASEAERIATDQAAAYATKVGEIKRTLTDRQAEAAQAQLRYEAALHATSQAAA
jgi:hypothetical protein